MTTSRAMSAFSRLRRRFSNKPNVIQTRQGAQRLPFRSYHPHWIVGRGLCMYRSEDFGNVPRNKRRAALNLKLPLWSPFASTGHHCVWEDGRAMVWFWDADAVPAVPPGGPTGADANLDASSRRCKRRDPASHLSRDGLPAPRLRWRGPACVPRRLRAAAMAPSRARALVLVPAASGPDACQKRPRPMGHRRRNAATGMARRHARRAGIGRPGVPGEPDPRALGLVRRRPGSGWKTTSRRSLPQCFSFSS